MTTLPAPDGFEWVEVGAYSAERQHRPASAMIRKGTSRPGHPGWWDGHPFGGQARGNDPLAEPQGGWERLYVLRPITTEWATREHPA
jgi:hypothetical protein